MSTKTAPLFALILFVLSVFVTPSNLAEAQVTTSSVVATGSVVTQDYPTLLLIPSIGLAAPIQGVGITADGAIDVPSGKTNNVGWYQYGTVPGQNGAAILDAHVFAAFQNLKNIQNNADVYVAMASGRILHFTVATAQNFAIQNLPNQVLFTNPSTNGLNLITCSGKLTADHSTYDHRLIVYTTFVGELGFGPTSPATQSAA